LFDVLHDTTHVTREEIRMLVAEVETTGVIYFQDECDRVAGTSRPRAPTRAHNKVIWHHRHAAPAFL